ITEPPPGYLINDFLPTFTIAIGDQQRPIRFVKKLNNGMVAGLTGLQGPDEAPHIFEVYAEEYNMNIPEDRPYEGLPPWLLHIMLAKGPGKDEMAREIELMGDWGLLADFNRFCALSEQSHSITGSLAALELEHDIVNDNIARCRLHLERARIGHRLKH